MALIVKICGLSTPEALDVALDAGADMVGFVFFPPSPRNVMPGVSRALGARVHGRARKVALTVDADDALFDAIVENLQPDLLQLHGKETPARMAALRKRFGLPLMKAIPVETESDLALIATYEPVADRLLFDARAPREATRPGGLGKSFDWHLSGKSRSEIAVHAFGRSRCRQCRASAADHARVRCRRVVGRRERAGREGS